MAVRVRQDSYIQQPVVPEHQQPQKQQSKRKNQELRLKKSFYILHLLPSLLYWLFRYYISKVQSSKRRWKYRRLNLKFLKLKNKMLT